MTGKNKFQPRGKEIERVVPTFDQVTLRSLVGERDENLKVIEKELEIKIGRDVEGLIVRGQDSEVDLAVDLLQQLVGLVKKG